MSEGFSQCYFFTCRLQSLLYICVWERVLLLGCGVCCYCLLLVSGEHKMCFLLVPSQAWAGPVHLGFRCRASQKFCPSSLSLTAELCLLSCAKENVLPISLWYETSYRILSSVQFSCSVVSDSLRPHEPQHTRPPCPSPTPGVHSNSRPSSQWCHPAISSSVVPFSSCPQSLPASESFPMSQLFTWGGQSTGFSFSIISSKEIPGLISFRMDWLNLLAVQRTLKSLLQHHSSKASILWHSAFFTVRLSHPYMTTGKTIA